MFNRDTSRGIHSKRDPSTKTRAETGEPKMRAIRWWTYASVFILSCCTADGQANIQPVEATLCDLYQHPDQYAGKIVKVRGTIAGNDMWIDTFTQKSCLSW